MDNQVETATQSIYLPYHVGTPFISVMADDDGIYAKVKINANAQVTVLHTDTIIETFNTKLSYDSTKIYGYFNDGQSDVEGILSQIQGLEKTPDELSEAIYNAIDPSTLKEADNRGFVTVLLNDLVLFACYSYVEVDLGDNNTYYNVDYIPYSEKNTKTGRTYSWPNNREIMDPSDDYFLSELNDLQQSDMNDFYTGVANFLVSSNTSNLSQPTLSTDFFAVYTAELIRYVMVSYEKDPWAIDLAQVVMLASYVNVSGMVYYDGKFEEGNITYYGNKGSIGNERDDFTQLSQYITGYLKANDSSLVSDIENLIGVSNSEDIIRDTLTFLSQPMENPLSSDDQSELITKMTDLTNTLAVNSSAITTYIQGQV